MKFEGPQAPQTPPWPRHSLKHRNIKIRTHYFMSTYELLGKADHYIPKILGLTRTKGPKLLFRGRC